MAKLAPVVESLEAIPEPQREFYAEQDGKYVLDTDIEQHPGVGGLKSALRKEKEARAERGKKVGELETTVAELKAQIEEREDKGKPTADLDKLLKKRETELRAEYEPVVKERDELKGRLLKRDRDDVIRGAAEKSGIIPARMKDALRSADEFLDFKDGKVVVLDDDGDPTGITLEKFFADRFKTLKPWYYEGSGSSGSGAPVNGAPRTGDTVALTADEASDAATLEAALKKVGGDYAKLKIAAAQ